MVSINKNTTPSKYPTTSPTVTTTCQVATTSVATTCNAINTPTSTNNNVKTYTASAPKTITASNTPTPTPTAVNDFVPTPTSISKSALTPTPVTTEMITYTTRVTGYVSGSYNPAVTSTPEITATPDYTFMLKVLEDALWETNIGRRANALLEDWENYGQNLLDVGIETVVNYIMKPSVAPMPTPTPNPTLYNNSPASSSWTDNFGGEITNGGYKNLGVKGGYYTDDYYIEAKYQVKGYEVSAGKNFNNGQAKIGTTDFKNLFFNAWFNNFCGGNISAATKYCIENGSTSIDINWFNDKISFGATAGDDYYGISATLNF